MLPFLVLTGAWPAVTAADVPESTEPIILIRNNWTSQLVLVEILGEIYRRRGYTVSMETVEVDEQWSGLQRGHQHIQVEVWEGTMASAFSKALKRGHMLDAGSHRATTREEWWYPDYVRGLCPGLPDWRALRNCAEVFATDETRPRGLYITGPWEKPERARIRALGLPFVVQKVPSSEDLGAWIRQAYEVKAPLLIFNWTPNWVEARYEGEFVEFPEYAPECETDPAWGLNENRSYDCGNPKGGWLKKAAWRGVELTWPCAFSILRLMDFDNRMIATVAAMVEADGLSHRQAALRWLERNETLWLSWIPATCR